MYLGTEIGGRVKHFRLQSATNLPRPQSIVDLNYIQVFLVKTIILNLLGRIMRAHHPLSLVRSFSLSHGQLIIGSIFLDLIPKFLNFNASSVFKMLESHVD